MNFAWLDSLSEDWASQPSLTDNTSPPSNIRSARGRLHSRSISASTTQSVQHHTIQRKSGSLSPKKETPEWKRRLLQGDVAYGEQRDLFSPVGLENIFRTPQPQQSPLVKLRSRTQSQEFEEGSAMMFSSPPTGGSKREPLKELESNSGKREEMDDQKRKGPRVAMKYKLTDDGISDFSATDITHSSDFVPMPATAFTGSLGGSRAISGESIRRNEELSPICLTRNGTSSVAAANPDVSGPAALKEQEDDHPTDYGTNTATTPKRMPKSPLKDPDAKRQKTTASEPVVGKKRKDAVPGDDQQPADPEILALRQISKPHLREKSITTQDFLDEAKKIMEGIRGKAGNFLDEDSYQESTQEPFSRPPSREGKPISRLPVVQEDPALLDHLRKYQETSDIDDVIASSVRTMAMAKEAMDEIKDIERMTDETISKASGRVPAPNEFVESDPPNIRLSENPELQRKRKHSSSTISSVSEGLKETEFPSNGSRASSTSTQSTTRSIPTGSSRGSDSRRVIAPHTVAHLIPEQLAGMVFDRERSIWVKGKSVSPEKPGQRLTWSDESEEDPFGDIPDLSVDETQERHRMNHDAQSHEQNDSQRHPIKASDPKLPARRNATISFSSPLASIINPLAPEYRLESISEQDEESTDVDTDGQHPNDVSFIVTAPLSNPPIAVVTPRPARSPGTLALTPLSEFTVHEDDSVSFGMNVSYVAGGQRYTHGIGQQRTLSLSIKEMVEKLTEVEPYEPYWEDLKQLDLKKKNLKTLHKLDKFCGKIEDLDVSHNDISQLGGAPGSVRNLRAAYNCLSDLTAWSHLNNLQYIDISNNELESLWGLQSLVHLRGIRADNNKISSLDGVEQLDGLLSLRLRGNLIESVDFKGARLHRLTEFDLKDNHVRDVQNIHKLLSLSDLNLEGNEIPIFPQNGPEMLNLKYLRLSGNKLTSIDLSPFPNLRLAYFDRNRLGTITGILKAKYLDSLSMREQQDGAKINMSFLCEAFEVRKLFLSGNLLDQFEPNNIFLNLQYLELANCGLDSLLPSFGAIFPNVRVLNLNYNALKDLKPLLGIRRLKRLYIAGNRLARLKRVTKVLSTFSSLSETDLRGNPITLGFYPPILDTGLAVRKAHDGGEKVEPFTIGAVEREKDSKYAARLDMETKSMRRIYEVLMLDCPRLRILDGLEFDRTILDLKDAVWDTLMRSGVLEKNRVSSEPLLPSWPAEDSFA